jgi:hypothetical protein
MEDRQFLVYIVMEHERNHYNQLIEKLYRLYL